MSDAGRQRMAKRKKAKQKKRNTGLRVIYLALMAVFISELLFYTWCRVQCVQIRYDISDQISEQVNLEALRNNLKIELARLKSPKRISKIARERLGLIMPTSKQTMVLP